MATLTLTEDVTTGYIYNKTLSHGSVTLTLSYKVTCKMIFFKNSVIPFLFSQKVGKIRPIVGPDYRINRETLQSAGGTQHAVI